MTSKVTILIKQNDCKSLILAIYLICFTSLGNSQSLKFPIVEKGIQDVVIKEVGFEKYFMNIMEYIHQLFHLMRIIYTT